MKKPCLTLSILAVIASLGGTFADSACLAEDKTTEEKKITEAKKILEAAPAPAVAKIHRLQEVKNRLSENFTVTVSKEDDTHLQLVALVEGQATVQDVVEKLKGGGTEILADIVVHLQGKVDEDKKEDFIKEVAEANIDMKEDPQFPGKFSVYNCGPNQREQLAQITKAYADAYIYFWVDRVRITVDVEGDVLAKVGPNGQVSVEDLVKAAVTARS